MKGEKGEKEDVDGVERRNGRERGLDNYVEGNRGRC